MAVCGIPRSAEHLLPLAVTMIRLEQFAQQVDRATGLTHRAVVFVSLQIDCAAGHFAASRTLGIPLDSKWVSRPCCKLIKVMTLSDSQHYPWSSFIEISMMATCRSQTKPAHKADWGAEVCHFCLSIGSHRICLCITSLSHLSPVHPYLTLQAPPFQWDRVQLHVQS